MFRIIIIGDSGVGKSSLLLRYTDDAFTESFITTIGVDFRVKTVELKGGKRVKLQIWDTAGQERFRNITTAYYRGAQGVLLTYDITSRASFEHVQSWLADLERHGDDPHQLALILVGNKADLGSTSREVETKEGEALAKKQNMFFVETSARTALNVDTLFLELTNQMMSIRNAKVSIHDDPHSPPLPFVRGTDERPQGGPCCRL